MSELDQQVSKNPQEEELKPAQSQFSANPNRQLSITEEGIAWAKETLDKREVDPEKLLKPIAEEIKRLQSLTPDELHREVYSALYGHKIK